MILAPLRGVTVRCFRETFAKEIIEAGFTEAVTPFIPAIANFNPLADRELAAPLPALMTTPQFIGKDAQALKVALKRIKEAGYTTADLNCGCPYPMVRNKGRGAGLLRTPEVLRSLLEVGCEVMGEGKFSIKTRLGLERKDELLRLLPMINEYPLRHLTLHARTARQMYEGECDWEAAEEVIKSARMPVVRNGDLGLTSANEGVMVGRAFIRALGAREDARELVGRYLESSLAELASEHAVLGRIKELLAYWRELSAWKGRWAVIKICRSIGEIRAVI